MLVVFGLVPNWQTDVASSARGCMAMPSASQTKCGFSWRNCKQVSRVCFIPQRRQKVPQAIKVQRKASLWAFLSITVTPFLLKWLSTAPPGQSQSLNSATKVASSPEARRKPIGEAPYKYQLHHLRLKGCCGVL